MQGSVPGGDKPHHCRMPSQDCSVPIPTALLSTGCSLWLQKAAGQCLSCPSQLPAAPPLQGLPVLGVGSCSSLLPQGSSLPQPPWPENPVLPQKEKSALSKPRPAPPCPHEPVHGDRTPTSDKLAVPLFGLSWFSLQDISRSILSTSNLPAGPRPSLAPPQPKPLAAAQSCGVLGSGSPWHLALPKWQPPHPEPPPQREEG